ncbi:LysR family transcriptional regulator [Roseovarius gaetbuli]|uniref:LysR family transcriptional regulator n=1 Tax=Roseovarius gaetbuli TaxID=1356575 RepID=UPI00351FC3D8
MNLDPQQLAALCAILRCGTFDAAAADLGLTQSAISQRLKALETRVGAQLVHRGQPSTGTAAGLRLAAHGDQIALLEAQLARQITGLAPRAADPAAPCGQCRQPGHLVARRPGRAARSPV